MSEGLGEMLNQLSKAMEEGASDKVYAPSMGVNDFEFPMEVKEFAFGRMGVDEPLLNKIGDFVAIRPVAEEYDNKTFLGVLLGDFPISPIASFRPSTGKLVVVMKTNPAIFVPDLNKVIFGCESWWGKIKDENHLREITNEDIQNVWYVKALQAMSEKGDEAKGQNT